MTAGSHSDSHMSGGIENLLDTGGLVSKGW